MIIIIAAIGQNNELGKENKLIWSLPSDLEFFKEHTLGKKIIMGSKTFESLKKPLKNRYHIVITSKSISSEYSSVMYTNDVEMLIKQYKDSEEEIYVIGGASIYKVFLNDVKTMYLTEVAASDKEADTYFPTFDKEEWNQIELDTKEENGIAYKHVMYKKNK